MATRRSRSRTLMDLFRRETVELPRPTPASSPEPPEGWLPPRRPMPTSPADQARRAIDASLVRPVDPNGQLLDYQNLSGQIPLVEDVNGNPVRTPEGEPLVWFQGEQIPAGQAIQRVQALRQELQLNVVPRTFAPMSSMVPMPMNYVISVSGTMPQPSFGPTVVNPARVPSALQTSTPLTQSSSPSPVLPSWDTESGPVKRRVRLED